jgi:hypothetical protein
MIEIIRHIFTPKESVYFNLNSVEDFEKEIRAIYKQGGLPGREKIFVCDAATSSLFSFTYYKYRETTLTLEGRYSPHAAGITKIRLKFLPDMLSIFFMFFSLLFAIGVLMSQIYFHFQPIGIALMLIAFIVPPLLVCKAHNETREKMIEACVRRLRLVEKV